MQFPYTVLILNSTILSTDAVFMPNKILKNTGSLFAKILSVSQYYQISTCIQTAKAEKKKKDEDVRVSFFLA